jgi:hypothetical protein
VQKSLCGFKETTNELQEILQVRKEKSESWRQKQTIVKSK